MLESTKTIQISEQLANGNMLNVQLTLKRPSLRDRININQKRGLYAGNNPDTIALYQAEVIATVETVVQNLPIELSLDSLDASDFKVYEKIYNEILNWVNFFRKE